MLGGCNVNTEKVKTETRTLVIEENINDVHMSLNTRGIENSAISMNNPLFVDAINNIKNKTNTSKETVTNPEEIQYGGTVYVDKAYENETMVYIEPEIEHIEEAPNMSYIGNYSITAYTWTGNTMANGEWPYVGCAASCDFPLGTVLYIEGVGTYIVNDVCPTSGVVDIYMDSYDECINFGRQYANVHIIN